MNQHPSFGHSGHWGVGGGRRAPRLLAFVAVGLILSSALASGAVAAPSSGTSLAATKTSVGHLVKRFGWTLKKTATPSSITMSNDDPSTTVQYEVKATKNGGTLEAWFDGSICVTNTGSVATQGLAITDSLSKPPSKQTLASVTLTIVPPAPANLQPGQTFCYPYRIDVPTLSITPGATYKDSATVKITNKSGPGSGPTPSATAALPATPGQTFNDSISVSDTNGSSWTFTGTGTQSYTKAFTCDADDGSHTNTVSTTGYQPPSGGSAPTASATVTVTCLDPDVTVTKSVDHATGTAGDTLTYTVTVSNIGSGTAHGVSLTDSLPALTGLAIDNTGDFDLSGGSLTLKGQPLASLATGASLTVNVTGTIPLAACESTLTNQASVSATNEQAAQNGNNSSSQVSTVVSCVNLEVTKTPDADVVSAGDQIGYTIEVSNSGAGPAQSVTLTDTLAYTGGLVWSLDGGTGVADCTLTPAAPSTNQVLGCSFGDLAGGASKTVRVVSPTHAFCVPTSNTATASATGIQPVTSDLATITINCPDVGISKAADASPISAGDTAGFVITVSNSGAGTAHGTDVEDTLPTNAGLSWAIDAGGSDSGCTISSGQLSCPFGDLAPLASKHVHITSLTTPSTCGTIDNTASVTASNEPAANDGNNSSQASITVNCPNVTVSKVPDAGTIDGGDDAGYTITVTNGGDGTANGVTLTDTLPTNGGLSWAIDDANSDLGCSITSGVLSCPFGDVGPLASKHVHITSPTTFDTCGTIDNTATATALNEAVADQSDNSSSAPIAVSCASIGVTKAADQGSVNAGADIGFVITATNNGAATAHGTDVEDTLPTNTGLSWSVDASGSDSGCTILSSQLSCDFGDIGPGTSKHVRVTSPTTADTCPTLASASVSVPNSVTVSITNGTGGGANASIDVLCPNDPPVNAVPGGQSVSEDTDLTFSSANSNLISISDPDAGSADVKVTLGVLDGTLTLSGTAGLAFTTGDGTADASMVFTGSISAVNSALNGMKYRGNLNFNDSRGAETLTITTDDQGNSGFGGAMTDTDTVAISVTAVNDAPSAAAKSFTVQANMKITGLSGLLTGATDPDTGDGGYSATFTVHDIVLNTCTNGTISNINAAAGTFDFDPPPGVTGTCTLQYRVDDSGNPGTATSAYANISITINGPVIWFVNSAVVGPGDGRLSNPFKTLASADGVDASGHRIFLYSGTYTSGITLNSDEWLIGQGVTGASFDSVFSITPPAGTIARPTIGSGTQTVQGTITLNTNAIAKALAISTGSSTGLNDPAGAITGVTVDQTSVATTTGTAVLLTSFGGSVTLSSVSSNGAANGISLSSTTGSFTVTGSGSTGSGGTVQSSTDSGVFASGAANINLSYMTIQNNGNAQNEGGVRLINVTGSGQLTSSSVTGSSEDNVYLSNSSGTLTAFNIQGPSCFIGNNNLTIGNTGVTVLSASTATMTTTINNCSFSGNRSDTIHTDAGDTATLTANITNNVITAGTAGNNQGNIGIDVTVANNGVVNFHVDNNKVGTPDGTTAASLLNTGINIFNGTLVTSGTPASITGTVKNNVVINDNSAPSGTSNGFGIRLFNQGYGTMAANVSGNTVSNINTDYGIFVEVSSNGGTANATGTTTVGVTNNTANVKSGALDAIRVQARGRSVMNARINGNVSSTHGAGFFGLEIRQAAQTINSVSYQATFNLEGLTTGLQTNHTTIVNYLNSQNLGIVGGCDEIHSDGITGVPSVSGIPS